MENEIVAMSSSQAPVFRAGNRNLARVASCRTCNGLYPGASKLPTFMGNAVLGTITTLITTHQ